MEQLRRFLTQENICFEEDLPLARYATLRIGGPAKLAVFPTSKEAVIKLLERLSEQDLRYVVIGNASNVLFSDAGYNGVVLFTTQWKETMRSGNELTASAGVSLPSLSRMAWRESLSGLEFAQGIPGTVGGAVLMNAGAYGGEIGKLCRQSTCFDADSGKVVTFSGDAQNFGYRTSVYQTNPRYTVLEVRLSLLPDAQERILARMEEYAESRRAKQPLDLPSAGSTFRRPEGYFAGKLIEDCGLKGYRIGGAEVSTKHAGFLVNRGGATAADVLALIESIQERVRSTFGVELHPEIRTVGP